MESLTRQALIARLIAAAERDPRIVGLADYGSSSEGRVDQWSDVDVALFIRDADFPAFERDWKAWAAQLGDLLLAYVGGVGHPWTVYDADPIPLRADFNFDPESALPKVATWPNAPLSAATMVLYDGTGGRLTEYAAQLVGRSLAPADLAQTFDSVCGDFWYYLIRTTCKLRRGQHWEVRQDFHGIVLNLLIALLKLEAGAVNRWRASSAAAGVEQALPAARLAQLEACLPGRELASFLPALRRVAALGQETCAACAARYGWGWPERLGARVIAVLADT